MATALPGGHVEGFLQTWRRDNWWLGPALTVAGLGTFGVYMLIVAFQASYYVAGPYMSPFYSPPLFIAEGVPGGTTADHAFVGPWPAWWPAWLPASPAFFIIPLPSMFRGTCYYYRKAYYRAFFGLPPACAVGPMKYPGRYEGETALLVFQNLHRYTLYIGIGLLPFLFYEAIQAFSWDGRFGVGIGSVLLLVNACLLTGYTFGCHAWRHLIGGRLNCFSCDGASKAQGRAWHGSSWLNERHMEFAWVSLFWFLGTDIFVRGVSMGLFPDVNTWHGVTWVADFLAAGGR
jgi:hypothetical protein